MFPGKSQKETRLAFFSSSRVWNKAYCYFQLTLGWIKNCICYHNSTTMNVREHKNYFRSALHYIFKLIHPYSVVACSQTLYFIFRGRPFDYWGKWGTGGGMGDLVWVRIFFPQISGDIIFSLSFNGVRYFFSIIHHDRYIFMSAGYFFPRKQSALYFFQKSPIPLSKVQWSAT